jgi:siroheme synthase-like protein
MPYYYPVFLNLEGRRCLVIGGNGIAAEKALGLVEAGARVTVVAEQVRDEIAEAALLGQLEWMARAWQPGDLEGFYLAVCAPDDRGINGAVHAEAERYGVLFNAIDDPPHCGFIFASVHRQGDLVMAVSTSGVAPALGVRIRRCFGELLGPEYDAFLRMAKEYREAITTQLPAFPPRRDLWYRIVDSDILSLLRAGNETTAREHFERFLREAGIMPVRKSAETMEKETSNEHAA